MSRRLTTYTELADALDRLGQLVTDARRARGLDQRSAAAQAGVTASTLCRLEAGRSVALDTAVRLLRWLGQPAHQTTITGTTGDR